CLHNREPDPRRRTDAERSIRPCRNSEPDTGEPKNPRVGVLASEVARALARSIPDVAEHEEIAERGAGEACKIDRFASPQALHKSTSGIGNRGGLCIRLRYLVDQRRVDADAAIGRKLEEALRKVRIASGEGRLDFALRDALVERAVERLVGDLDR